MSTTIEVKLRLLTRFDFCDTGCGARSTLIVKTPTGELTFCSHHGSKNVQKFIEKGYPYSAEKDYEDDGNA